MKIGLVSWGCRVRSVIRRSGRAEAVGLPQKHGEDTYHWIRRSHTRAPARAMKGRGRGRGRGGAHGEARGPDRAATEEPPVAPVGGQAPEAPVATAALQETWKPGVEFRRAGVALEGEARPDVVLFRLKVTQELGQYSLYYQITFCVLQLFAINEGEVHVIVPSIIHYNEPYNVSVDVGTDCESSKDDEPYAYVINSSDYDTHELDLFRKERTREVNDKLDKYKELEMGMSFKDLAEAKRVVGYYAVVNNKGLRVEKSDTGRVRYSCDVGCPFVCLISRDNRAQGFKIKTLKSKHNCVPAYKNRRATPQALAYYFKNKVQNNPKYKVKEMRVDLEDIFSLNISYSKMKRVKRLVLEKLEGSYIDDYNRLEAYAQELRDSNPGSDVIINISKDALAEGKRRFLRMYVCFQALKSGWKAGLRPLIDLDGTFLKEKCRRILMVAMAQDSVKHFYPLAWAVVDRETSRI
uniref:Transposase MuDR plant domain-containing protein n=1 Tax=Nicotiana tabacum TaxID=4097 RepID=A0A1S3ZEL7_TOBAC|nr:PREDICTED: uncharacterized protein LOC107785964 [Nicotiana tabacum]